MKRVELRDRLREAMDRRGMRATDLVEKTGIPKGTLSYYLSGKTEPKSGRIYLLAQALDISEAWLLGYDVPMGRTDNQKKNDQLAKLTVMLRNDEDFYNTVVALTELTEGQYSSIKQLIATFNE